MAFRSVPSYLWCHRSGTWYFKRPIPPDLRARFPATKSGKPSEHILISLRTKRLHEAVRLRADHMAVSEQLFREYAGAGGKAPTSPLRARLAEIRAAMHQVMSAGADEDAIHALENMAQEAAEELESDVGEEAAVLAYRATVAQGRSLKEHMAEWHPASGLTKQTQQEHVKALQELLDHLRVEDCQLASINEQRHAVPFVEVLMLGT